MNECRLDTFALPGQIQQLRINVVLVITVLQCLLLPCLVRLERMGLHTLRAHQHARHCVHLEGSDSHLDVTRAFAGSPFTPLTHLSLPFSYYVCVWRSVVLAKRVIFVWPARTLLLRFCALANQLLHLFVLLL